VRSRIPAGKGNLATEKTQTAVETRAAAPYIAHVIPLPISDENPTSRTPVVTILLIVVNALVWLYELGHGVELSLLDYGAIPAWVLHGIRDGRLLLPDGERVFLHQEVPPPFSILTSMFMHASWLHIIGNLWFLWIFGDNVEDRMGPVKYLVFYLLCGVAAAMAQIAVMPDNTTPMVGASGAIAGVLGAYALLYPRARVRCLWILIIFITTIRVPAWLLLGIWFLSQFLVPSGSGVAWMAHVGGFVTGLILVKLFARRPPPRYLGDFA
jgi:membrane associated rhomboid family serine protease